MAIGCTNRAAAIKGFSFEKMYEHFVEIKRSGCSSELKYYQGGHKVGFPCITLPIHLYIDYFEDFNEEYMDHSFAYKRLIPPHHFHEHSLSKVVKLKDVELFFGVNETGGGILV